MELLELLVERPPVVSQSYVDPLSLELGRATRIGPLASPDLSAFPVPYPSGTPNITGVIVTKPLFSRLLGGKRISQQPSHGWDNDASPFLGPSEVSGSPPQLGRYPLGGVLKINASAR